jgi:hypothetical protein
MLSKSQLLSSHGRLTPTLTVLRSLFPKSAFSFLSPHRSFCLQDLSVVKHICGKAPWVGSSFLTPLSSASVPCSFSLPVTLLHLPSPQHRLDFNGLSIPYSEFIFPMTIRARFHSHGSEHLQINASTVLFNGPNNATRDCS